MGQPRPRSSLAIACSSGGYKGVFVSGVLAAFEAAGVRADAYAGASSTALPAACATVGLAARTGPDYWRRGLDVQRHPGKGMSEVVLGSIAFMRPTLAGRLFQPGTPRLLVATSQVVTEEGTELTQGKGARRLGQQLLLSAARGDRTWVDENLRPAIFDSAAEDGHRLYPGNFEEVVYASTRMLHAWVIPASIEGGAFVDASYTCSCPAQQLAELGYERVIAIGTEPGLLARDLFGTPVPATWRGAAIENICPDRDIKELGVDFTTAMEEGLVLAYRHGEEIGRRFLEVNDPPTVLTGERLEGGDRRPSL